MWKSVMFKLAVLLLLAGILTTQVMILLSINRFPTNKTLLDVRSGKVHSDQFKESIPLVRLWMSRVDADIKDQP